MSTGTISAPAGASWYHGFVRTAGSDAEGKTWIVFESDQLPYGKAWFYTSGPYRKEILAVALTAVTTACMSFAALDRDAQPNSPIYSLYTGQG